MAPFPGMYLIDPSPKFWLGFIIATKQPGSANMQLRLRKPSDKKNAVEFELDLDAAETRPWTQGALLP